MERIKATQVWYIVNKTDHPSLIDEDKKIGVYFPITEELFPGINIDGMGGFFNIAEKYLTPLIRELFPLMEGLHYTAVDEKMRFDITGPFLKCEGEEFYTNGWSEKFHNSLLHIKKERNDKIKIEQFKPSLDLNPLEKVIVNTQTQQEYNTLMKIYESGGWLWDTGEYPTQKNIWREAGSETCIDAGIDWYSSRRERFRYNSISIAREFEHMKDKKIITPEEFYKIQNINKKES